MRKKIMGVTVGTTISPKKIEEKINPVKTVNGKGPDKDGNVKVEGGSGYSIYVSTEQHPEIGYDVITGMDDSYIETNGRAIQVNDLIIMGRYLYRVTVVNDTSFDAELVYEFVPDLSDYAKKNEVPGKTSELDNDSGFITKTVSDLANYYLKSETLSKTEINNLISAVPKFSIQVVTTLPTSGISSTTVYLVKSGSDADLYTEYIYVNNAWEVIGSQRVDLSGYALQTDIPTKLSELSNDVDFLTNKELTSAINTALTDAKQSGMFDGKDGKDATANYGVCSTAAGTAAKVVNVDGFELKAGEVVTVKFTATNTVANPTLNVNSTGAYAIIYKGNSIAAYSAFGVGALEADKLYQFVFTGSNYELVGGLHVDRLAGTNAGYAKSGGDIDFSAGVGTLKDGVVPVKSVNGKTGAVTLDADDVGARPSTWTPSYSDVGADKSGAAAAAVSGHNTNNTAHNDIRLLIEGLVTRLDALANSDDTTLDQMAEVVKYIKDNRDLISQITTDKVSVSDIVNNLTTNVSNRPLSAAQGVALKALIDAITVPTKLSELSGDSTHRVVTDTEKAAWNAKSDFSGAYKDLTGQPTIPTVPTKVSAFENDKGYLTLNTLPKYDGGVS